MSVTTKTKTQANVFEQDISNSYELEMPTRRPNAYDLDIIDIHGEEEQYMIDSFHKQSVAVEGRSAIAQFMDTRIGEIATNSSYAMTTTLETIEAYETGSRVGRYARKLQEFNNRLIDQTARHILETDTIAVRSMQEDIRRPIYQPLPPPPPPLPAPKKRGMLRGIGEFLFGEE